MPRLSLPCRLSVRSQFSNRSSAAATVVAGLACALLFSAAGLSAAAGRGNPNPGVMPPHSNAFGQDCGEWAADWWQWALSFSADESPLLDETGERAASGQSGKVWFLAGIAGAAGDVQRTVTIPAGKAVFFPVFNYVWVNTPEFGDPEWSPEQEAFARDLIAGFVDEASVSAEIDGRPVQDLAAYRCQNDEPFMVTMPDGNTFGIPGGTYGPSVADGYWLMLPPLSPGRHTIHFHSVSDGAVQDVTYHITVRGGKK